MSATFLHYLLAYALAKRATAFDETTQIRMYYFAGTRLNFQPRDTFSQAIGTEVSA